jgi:dTDP-glucose pyrophosphorylase/CBS domain-containing protein
MVELERFLVGPDSSIRDVMACLDRNAKGIALVVDEERRLLGTVTDGDIRRAILDRVSLDAPASELLARKIHPLYRQPTTARLGTPPSDLLRLMQERSVRHVPLLDEAGRVADLVTLNDLLPEQVLPLQAVIMAGGLGTRLRPLTEDLPKPMLPIGDRPLMELTIEQLRQAGIRRVNVTTHYQPDKIVEHFADGSAFGVELIYVNEDQPLGTAGGLGLLAPPQEPLLVINGDILTRVDFRVMLAYHREHGADMTVGVRRYDLQVPYGVVESDGLYVRHLTEKPLLSFFVNAGIYLLEPSVYQYIPPGRDGQGGQRFNMTDLIQRLLDEGRPVVSFPIVEYWLDIGQHADYAQAQEDALTRRGEVH